jgi:hypothetical protein
LRARRPRPYGGSRGLDARQQRLGRFATGILAHRPPFKRTLKHRLPQPTCARQARRDRRLQLPNDRQPPLDLGDDAVLFGERWKGYCQLLQHVEVDVLLRRRGCISFQVILCCADEVLNKADIARFLDPDESYHTVGKAGIESEDGSFRDIGGNRDAKGTFGPEPTLCESDFVIGLRIGSDRSICLLDITGLDKGVRSPIQMRIVSRAML